MKRIRPAVLGFGILVGVAVGCALVRKFRTSASDGSWFALFGETTAKVGSDQLTTVDATAVFGAVNLDLREARIDEEATVDALALFGGVEVLIPKRWRLALSGTPIFGAVEDKTSPDEALPADAPVLNLTATAVFGGVAVANEPGQAARRKAKATAR
jgi:hypothetical protein